MRKNYLSFYLNKAAKFYYDSGYYYLYAQRSLQFMAHFGNWLKRKGISLRACFFPPTPPPNFGWSQTVRKPGDPARAANWHPGTANRPRRHNAPPCRRPASRRASRVRRCRKDRWKNIFRNRDNGVRKTENRFRQVFRFRDCRGRVAFAWRCGGGDIVVRSRDRERVFGCVYAVSDAARGDHERRRFPRSDRGDIHRVRACRYPPCFVPRKEYTRF